MLVMQFKRGEAVTIGDNVEVVMLDRKLGKLGLKAPREVPIKRTTQSLTRRRRKR